MKRFIIVLIITSLFIACNQKDQETVVIEGDLYFKLIDVETIFQLPDSTLTMFEYYVATANVDQLDDGEKELYKLLEYAISNDLLRKPYIRIRTDDDKVQKLFINTVDYAKFESFNCWDLQDEHKKIRIKAIVSELNYDTIVAYEAEELLSIEKIDGSTGFQK